MRSPVAMSNGCAPVFPSYSAITLFTSSMSAVAGSYSRSVVSPRDENVTILAFMFWSPVGRSFLVSCGKQSVGFGSLPVILHRLPELSILLSRANDSEEPAPRSHGRSPADNTTVRFSDAGAGRKYFRQRTIVLRGQIRLNRSMIRLRRTYIFR